jgi:hypothetical protein
VKKYNGQGAANIGIQHYYRPIHEAQMIAVTNETGAPVQQDANGVLQYTSAVEGFWQNPGY